MARLTRRAHVGRAWRRRSARWQCWPPHRTPLGNRLSWMPFSSSSSSLVRSPKRRFSLTTSVLADVGGLAERTAGAGSRRSPPRGSRRGLGFATGARYCRECLDDGAVMSSPPRAPASDSRRSHRDGLDCARDCGPNNRSGSEEARDAAPAPAASPASARSCQVALSRCSDRPGTTTSRDRREASHALPGIREREP